MPGRNNRDHYCKMRTHDQSELDMHMGGNQREESSMAKEVDMTVTSGTVGMVVYNRVYTVKEYNDNHVLPPHPNSSSSCRMKM